MLKKYLLFLYILSAIFFIVATSSKVSAVYPEPYWSGWVTDVSVPTTMLVGETKQVKIRIYGGDEHQCEAQNPDLQCMDLISPQVKVYSFGDNWNTSSPKNLPKSPIKFNQQDSGDLTFNITAPATPGTYKFWWRLEQYYIGTPWGPFGSTIQMNITVIAPTLDVDLTVAQNDNGYKDSWTGIAPLNDIDLKSVVSGTATGTIRYRVWCDQSKGVTHDHSGETSTTHKDLDLCDYPTPGTYIAKVVVNRGGLQATNTATITVESPPTVALHLSTTSSNWVKSLDLTAPVQKIVDLRGTVTNGSGNIDYYFWCHNPSNDTSTAGADKSYLGIATNPKVSADLCAYPDANTYKPKVVIRRNGLLAYDHGTITVTPPTTLSVSLAATPDSGTTPLSSVLTATVSGSASGTINYNFWYDCTNSTTDIGTANAACGTLSTPANGTCIETLYVGYKCNGINDNPKSIPPHSYTTGEEPTTYTPKVIVERGGAPSAQAQSSVTVDPPPPGTTGTLQVIKTVINNDGGTAESGDFNITVTGNNPSPAEFPGAEAPGTDVTIEAGNYSVDEVDDLGYDKSLSADCSGTIAIGETKTCTITNDDVPPPIIDVVMSAEPDSGIQTIDSVLTATATSNDTSDTFNYSIWFDCNDDTTSVDTANTACGTLDAPNAGECLETPDIGYKCDGISPDILEESITHTYTGAGTYHPKVILEQDGATPVESRAPVTLTGDTPPDKPVVTLTAGDYCTTPGEMISWTYSDADDDPIGTDPQSQYQVQVDDQSSFTSPFIDETISGNSTSYFATGLDFNTTYYVRVAVWDTLGDLQSGWSATKNFTTPLHAYPQTDFTPPNKPHVNQSVPFVDTTIFDPESADLSWSWIFCTAGECLKPTASSQDVMNTFYIKKTYTVTLTATDDAGSCALSHPVTVTDQRLPGWREVSPK